MFVEARIGLHRPAPLIRDLTSCPGHPPAFASLRVPLRFAKGDGVALLFGLGF